MKHKEKDEFQYTIDDKPYTFVTFIEQAMELGFDPGEVRYTSQAARFLRESGHTVGYYKKPEDLTNQA